jgi:hypothetical protein
MKNEKELLRKAHLCQSMEDLQELYKDLSRTGFPADPGGLLIFNQNRTCDPMVLVESVGESLDDEMEACFRQQGASVVGWIRGRFELDREDFYTVSLGEALGKPSKDGENCLWRRSGVPLWNIWYRLRHVLAEQWEAPWVLDVWRERLDLEMDYSHLRGFLETLWGPTSVSGGEE